ncbi:MAG: hypothetical protein H6744_02950 [Deltaproteobacteria bacterium]|nr:hypothetical protein [Deltaproteobacteria bacterium]
MLARLVVAILLPCALFLGAQLAPRPPDPLHVYGPVAHASGDGRCATPALWTDSIACSSLQTDACTHCVHQLCAPARGPADGAMGLRVRYSAPHPSGPCAVTLAIAPSGTGALRHDAGDIVARNVLRPTDCTDEAGTVECFLRTEAWAGWDVALVRRASPDAPWTIAKAMHLTAIRMAGSPADIARFALAGLVVAAAAALLLVFARRTRRRELSALPRRSGAVDCALGGALGGGLGALTLLLTPSDVGGIVAGLLPMALLAGLLVGGGALLGACLGRREAKAPLPLGRGAAAVVALFAAVFFGSSLVADAAGLGGWPATQLRSSYLAYLVAATLAPLALVPHSLGRPAAPGATDVWTGRLALGACVGALVLCPLLGSAVSDLLQLSGPVAGLRGLGPPLDACLCSVAIALTVAGASLPLPAHTAPELPDPATLGLVTAVRTPLLLVERARQLHIGTLSLELTVLAGGLAASRVHEVWLGRRPCHGRLRDEVIATLNGLLHRPELAALAAHSLRLRVVLSHPGADAASVEGRSFQLPLALAALELAAPDAPGGDTCWMATGCLDDTMEELRPVDAPEVKLNALAPGRVLLAPPGTARALGRSEAAVHRVGSAEDGRRVASALARPGALAHGALVEVATTSAAAALTQQLRRALAGAASGPARAGVWRHVG